MSQTLEETHRENVTRLGKGLGKQNSIWFPSLLALVFQSGGKYLKPGRQHYLASQVQPGDKASLTLLKALRAASSKNSTQGHQNLCGVQRERLLLTHSPSYFAGILLPHFPTCRPAQSCRATSYPRGRHLCGVREAGQAWNSLPLGSVCSRSSW